MAKKKVYLNTVRLKEDDLIAKSSRASENVMIIMPFPIMLDVLFKTEGAQLAKNELAPFEKACKKVQGDYYKKMNQHVKELVKKVVDFQKLDQAGKQDAAGKAVAECKKAVQMLDGTLFDQMRVELRRTVEKLISDEIKKSNTLHFKQATETAGTSGFRNPRRSIYLAPGAFAFEQETDKAFAKAAVSITKGGKALRDEGKGAKTASDQAGLSLGRFLNALSDYVSDDASGPGLLKANQTKEFLTDFKQKDKGTFGKAKLDAAQLVTALDDLVDQLNGVEKQVLDFSKLLDPKKKKTLDAKARDDAEKTSKEMQKWVKPLNKNATALLGISKLVADRLDDKNIPTIARNNFELLKAKAALDSSIISDKNKNLDNLAKGCDALKKIIDKA